ncbi:hypothetical protein chiPu_0023183, partial [Chiloscyllium punctatum]|nr:hypothetical protein [Chiloscyllium punctatum]
MSTHPNRSYDKHLQNVNPDTALLTTQALHMISVGMECTTLALSVPRSNQL